MKTCEVFDGSNELINELALKRGTSKKWIVSHLLWTAALDDGWPELEIKDTKVVMKNGG